MTTPTDKTDVTQVSNATTENPNYVDNMTSFNADYQKLLDDLGVWEQSKLDTQDATDTYNKNVLSYSAGAGDDVFSIGAMMIGLLGTMAWDGGNMFMGDMNNTACLMDIIADLTACTNDVQELTNDTSMSSDSLWYASQDMNMLLDLFDPNSGSQASADLREGLGDTTIDTLYDQFYTMRTEIEVTGDEDMNKDATTGDPTTSRWNNSTNGSSTCYFVCGSSGDHSVKSDTYLTSYGEAYDYASLSGDPLDATEALDDITNSLNMALTTTQNVNQSEQTVLTNQSNQLQQLMTFVGFGFQNMTKECSGYVSNQIV